MTLPVLAFRAAHFEILERPTPRANATAFIVSPASTRIIEGSRKSIERGLATQAGLQSSPTLKHIKDDSGTKADSVFRHYALGDGAQAAARGKGALL
jgi:hypothetical protein